RIKTALDDDVLDALEHVVGQVGDRMGIGVDADSAHDPRNPFGSNTRAALLPALGSTTASFTLRAVMRLPCCFRAVWTHDKSVSWHGSETAQSPLRGSKPRAASFLPVPSMASSS